jgi:hypothetical protein
MLLHNKATHCYTESDIYCTDTTINIQLRDQYYTGVYATRIYHVSYTYFLNDTAQLPIIYKIFCSISLISANPIEKYCSIAI